MAIRSWVSANYLGNQNLKDTLDCIKRSIENVALSPAGLAIYDDTVTSTAIGLGTRLRVNGTFMYRIGDTAYIKGLGITQAVNTGDSTVKVIPHPATGDNTATGGYDVPATYYRAGVMLIDSNGAFTSKPCATLAGKSLGISAGGRLGALRNLINSLTTSDIEDKAVVAFWVVGDGTNAFTSTSSLTIATNLDIYNCGGMALATGVSTDGNQMLGLL
jgi:hypothetical protein